MYAPKPLTVHVATFITLLQLFRLFEAAALLSISANNENPAPILFSAFLVGTVEVIVAMSGTFVAGIMFTVRKPWARRLAQWWNIAGLVSACLAIALITTAKAWFITISIPLIILLIAHSPLLHLITIALLQRPSAGDYFRRLQKSADHSFSNTPQSGMGSGLDLLKTTELFHLKLYSFRGRHGLMWINQPSLVLGNCPHRAMRS
jgi:hypothetical protein